MTPLQSLKQILQEHLEVWQGKLDKSEAYIEALSDAQYACELGESALNTIFDTWSTLLTGWGEESNLDIDYYHGVEFVNDQWNIIKEKEDECIN